MNPYADKIEQGISIIIPTWDNLKYLKACIESIQTYSVYPHEIVVHINGGHDQETVRNYLEEQHIIYSHTTENVGVCAGINKAVEKATRSVLLYANDDMYLLPGWDTGLVKFIREHGIPELSFLSATMIEPTGNDPCTISPTHYGSTIETFQKEKLLREFQSLKHRDLQGTTWPPSLWSREIFNQIGGMDLRYSPGMGSDPDIAKRFYDAGCRYFAVVNQSRVYHFQNKSIGRIKLNNGRKVFYDVHGVDLEAFVFGVLRRGIPYTGSLPKNASFLYQCYVTPRLIWRDTKRFLVRLLKKFRA